MRESDIAVFKSTVKDQEALNKALPDRLEDSSSEDYVKALMKFVCFPSGTLKEGKLKPDEPALADSELERLTAEDLETFAEIYVQNNPYLFTKTHYRTKKGPEGNLVLTPSRGEIEHPKSDGESYVSYLFRLTLIQRSEKLEWAKKLSKSFSGFSGGVADSLRKKALLHFWWVGDSDNPVVAKKSRLFELMLPCLTHPRYATSRSEQPH